MTSLNTPANKFIMDEHRQLGFIKYYFVLLAILSLVVALVGFTPSYQAHLAGEYHIFPIAQKCHY